jgi:hypothetical protein
MADIIPVAIGCGITEERTWTMTYAELITEIEARRANREKEHQFLDHLNGKFCAIYASFHGVESCPLDYMVTQTKEQPDMSPEAIQERAFASFGGAS